MSSKDVNPPDLCTRGETISVFLNSLCYKHPWKDSPIQEESVPLLQDVYKQEWTTGNCCPTLRRKQRRKNPPIFIWEICIFLCWYVSLKRWNVCLPLKCNLKANKWRILQQKYPSLYLWLILELLPCILFMANTWNATLYFRLCEKYYAINKIFLLGKK